MKKLEKLKLNHLSDNVLDEKQQNVLKGGSSSDMGSGSSNGNSASMRISYL